MCRGTVVSRQLEFISDRGRQDQGHQLAPVGPSNRQTDAYALTLARINVLAFEGREVRYYEETGFIPAASRVPTSGRVSKHHREAFCLTLLQFLAAQQEDNPQTSDTPEMSL